MLKGLIELNMQYIGIKISYSTEVNFCSGTKIIFHTEFGPLFWSKPVLWNIENISDIVSDSGKDGLQYVDNRLLLSTNLQFYVDVGLFRFARNRNIKIL